MVNGQTVHQKAIDPNTKLPANTKQEAQNIEAKLRQRLLTGEPESCASMTVAEFVESVYLEWAKVNHTASHYQSDRWRTKVLCAEFGHLQFDQISTFAVERFKRNYLNSTTKRGDRRSPASVNRCLQLLSKLLSLAVSHKLLLTTQRPEIKLLREDNALPRYMTFDEEAKLRPLWLECGQYLFDLCVIWVNTGLRANEMFNLKKSQVDLQLDVIHVLKTKSSKARQVPIFGECREILARLCAGEDGLVIPSPKTGSKLDNVKKGFAAACKKAGITGLTPHKLRHTYGTRLAAAGVDVVTIKDLMGHSSISTTMRYVHAVSKERHSSITRLQNYIHANFTQKENGQR